MSKNALPSQGTKLSIGSGSPLSYSQIKEIATFSGPGGSGQVIDTSDLDSAAVEKIMGLPDEGQLTFEINYLPEDTQHSALRAARADQALTQFQLEFPDDSETKWNFDAYVTGFTVSGGVNAPVKASVTLEITGDVEEI